jgi:hypothetical protein
MKRNSNGSMSISTNGNVVRTKIKLMDSRGKVIATFATGNGWSDGKLDVDIDLIGNKDQIGILPAPEAIIEGAVNENDEFIISHRLMGELYGFWNHPERNGELTEALLKKIKTVLKSKGHRFELVKTQQLINKERREALARR